MTDVTIASFEEMEPIFESGLARRARATLGVSAWGMQVFTLPPDWDGYPEHNHDEAAFDPNQEEVYIPVAGSATLLAGEEAFELQPGMMARVGPDAAAADRAGLGRHPLHRARRAARELPALALD